MSNTGNNNNGGRLPHVIPQLPRIPGQNSIVRVIDLTNLLDLRFTMMEEGQSQQRLCANRCRNCGMVPHLYSPSAQVNLLLHQVFRLNVVPFAHLHNLPEIVKDQHAFGNRCREYLPQDPTPAPLKVSIDYYLSPDGTWYNRKGTKQYAHSFHTIV
jgi:hypothetical protein